MNSQPAMRIVVGCLLLGVSACGSDSVGRTYPVKGKVTLKGNALTRGSVGFFPDKAKGNQSPYDCSGQIGADGSYEMFTAGKAGVPPGHYKVTVVALNEFSNTEPEKARSLVPPEYTSPKTTPFSFEVIENPDPNRYDLAVK
jgi:hypothetical protein